MRNGQVGVYKRMAARHFKYYYFNENNEKEMPIRCASNYNL